MLPLLSERSALSRCVRASSKPLASFHGPTSIDSHSHKPKRPVSSTAAESRPFLLDTSAPSGDRAQSRSDLAREELYRAGGGSYVHPGIVEAQDQMGLRVAPQHLHHGLEIRDDLVGSPIGGRTF